MRSLEILKKLFPGELKHRQVIYSTSLNFIN